MSRALQISVGLWCGWPSPRVLCIPRGGLGSKGDSREGFCYGQSRVKKASGAVEGGEPPVPGAGELLSSHVTVGMARPHWNG